MNSIPFNIWKTGELTEHPGGVSATRRLLARGNLDSVRLMKRVGVNVGFNSDPVAAYPWALGIVENPVA